MSGETNLATLVASLSPALLDEEYVFCSLANSQYGDYQELEPIASMTEQEGMSLVIPKAKAEQHKLPYDRTYRCVSLGVHSSVEAIGLTACITGKLAEHGISANVIAGCNHDHIFIKSDHAVKAIAALDELDY